MIMQFEILCIINCVNLCHAQEGNLDPAKKRFMLGVKPAYFTSEGPVSFCLARFVFPKDTLTSRIVFVSMTRGRSHLL